MIVPEATIRYAELADLSLVFELIQKKAAFDRSMGSVTALKATPEKLQQTLFNTAPFARILLAEISQEPIGFALYYFRYSSFAAQPSLWLDDLFIDQALRGYGMGTCLMTHLRSIAEQNQCSYIAWTASVRNDRGISFYHKLGAKITKRRDNLLYFQMNL